MEWVKLTPTNKYSWMKKVHAARTQYSNKTHCGKYVYGRMTEANGDVTCKYCLKGIEREAQTGREY